MRLRRTSARLVRRLRPQTRAQAFVEFALAAPLVMLLVVGASQLGAVAYGMVSTDTAAREGARYGAEHPVTSLSQAAASPSHTYTCRYAFDNESVPTGNPICQAVYRAHGLLDPTSFTIVITTNLPLSSLRVAPDVVRMSNNSRPSPTALPCGSDAEVDGNISFNGGAPTQSVQVTANGQGTVPSATVAAGSTSYRLCLAVNSHTQTINAVMGSGCSGFSGQTTVNITNNHNPYTPSPDPIVLTANSCPTPPPTPTPTPTPTALPTPTAGPTPFPTDTPPPAFTCSNAAASSTGYFEVTVSYPVPIFVPLIGSMVGDQPPGTSTQRTVSATVVQRVEPCTITGQQ